MRQVTLTQEQGWSGHTVITVYDAATGEKLHIQGRLYSRDGIHGRLEPIQDVYTRAVGVCRLRQWQIVQKEA